MRTDGIIPDDDYSVHESSYGEARLTPPHRNSASTGSSGDERGPGGRKPDVQNPDPQRVAWPPFGLSVRQLVDGQRAFTAYARWRMWGVGQSQYDLGDHQKCEEMDLPRLLLEARDELADLCNYLAYMDMQLARLVEKVMVK